MESIAYTSFSDIVGRPEVQSALEVLGDIVEDIYGKVRSQFQLNLYRAVFY